MSDELERAVAARRAAERQRELHKRGLADVAAARADAVEKARSSFIRRMTAAGHPGAVPIDTRRSETYSAWARIGTGGIGDAKTLLPRRVDRTRIVSQPLGHGWELRPVAEQSDGGWPADHGLFLLTTGNYCTVDAGDPLPNPPFDPTDAVYGDKDVVAIIDRLAELLLRHGVA